MSKNKNGKNNGCCNLIIWDALAIIALACNWLPSSIHILFRILIGFVFVMIFLSLFNIPIVGFILNIGMGILWTSQIWETLNIGNWGFVKGDPIWEWGIKIFLGLMLTGLHLGSLQSVGINLDIDTDKKSDRENYEEYFEENEYTDANESFEQNSYEYNSRYYHNEQNGYRESQADQRGTESSSSFDPFAGCNSRESIMKRYKSLCKNFHPDTTDGDEEQMKLLNALYEEKLKVFG